MKESQCDCLYRHLDLLKLIWMWGGGCALQPLLVEIMVMVYRYASPQMCRRGIRELKKAGLLKAMHWTDGKTELLVLCKPAIAFFAEKPGSEVSSYPRHNTLDQEKLSVCRLLFAKSLILQMKKEEIVFLYEAICSMNTWTVCLKPRDLPAYYKEELLHRLPEREYTRQMEQLLLSQKQRMGMRTRVKGRNGDSAYITVETLHRHGIFVIGFSQKQADGQNKVTLVHFGYFGIHRLSVSHMRELLELCWRWAKSFGSSYEPHLIFYCTSGEQRETLEKQLYKQRASGQPQWEESFRTVTGPYGLVPFDFSHICEDERYFPPGF